VPFLWNDLSSIALLYFVVILIGRTIGSNINVASSGQIIQAYEHYKPNIFQVFTEEPKLNNCDRSPG
jgi:hypothetical protein